MVLSDLVNIAAGAYKGYMNAIGQEVDSTYLAVVLASTSTLSGIFKGIQVEMKKRKKPTIEEVILSARRYLPKEKDSVSEGIKHGLIAIPCGALEIALGYGLGWVASKIIK